MFKLALALTLFASSFLPAQQACRRSVGSQKTSSIELQARIADIKSGYRQVEVLSFVRSHRLLPENLINKIENRIRLFDLSGEDMGNATLMHVFSELGPHPSRQRDVLIKKFLAPVFEHYQAEFAQFVSKTPAGIEKRIPSLFGLSNLGFKTDSYGYIWMTKSDLMSYQQKLTDGVLFKEGFDLRAANRLLVQMALIHSIYQGKNKLSFSELKELSDQLAISETVGHVFVPTIGEWNLTNSVAQWHLRATVNMLPVDLNKNTEVHGGNGLSAFEGITHDQSHFMRWRFGAAAQALGLNYRKASDHQKIAEMDQKIKLGIERALLKYHQDSPQQIDPKMLNFVLLFFAHQPEALGMFIKANSQLKAEATAREFAREMRKYLEQNQEFYSLVGQRSDQFEITASYWVNLLANSMP